MRNSQRVRRQQTPHIAERRRRVIEVQPKQQKIADRSFVERIRHVRMHPYAIQYTAEHELIVEIRVVKRFNAKVIACTKESFPAAVPDSKREVPSQMVDALRAPCRISVKN